MCGSWEHCKNFEESISKSFKFLELTLHRILNYVVAGSENLKEWEKNCIGKGRNLAALLPVEIWKTENLPNEPNRGDFQSV